MATALSLKLVAFPNGQIVALPDGDIIVRDDALWYAARLFLLAPIIVVAAINNACAAMVRAMRGQVLAASGLSAALLQNIEPSHDISVGLSQLAHVRGDGIDPAQQLVELLPVVFLLRCPRSPHRGIDLRDPSLFLSFLFVSFRHVIPLFSDRAMIDQRRAVLDQYSAAAVVIELHGHITSAADKQTGALTARAAAPEPRNTPQHAI
jgi:hypothetical protein